MYLVEESKYKEIDGDGEKIFNEKDMEIVNELKSLFGVEDFKEILELKNKYGLKVSENFNRVDIYEKANEDNILEYHKYITSISEKNVYKKFIKKTDYIYEIASIIKDIYTKIEIIPNKNKEEQIKEELKQDEEKLKNVKREEIKYIKKNIFNITNNEELVGIINNENFIETINNLVDFDPNFANDVYGFYKKKNKLEIFYKTILGFNVSNNTIDVKRVEQYSNKLNTKEDSEKLFSYIFKQLKELEKIKDFVDKNFNIHFSLENLTNIMKKQNRLSDLALCKEKNFITGLFVALTDYCFNSNVIDDNMLVAINIVIDNYKQYLDTKIVQEKLNEIYKKINTQEKVKISTKTTEEEIEKFKQIPEKFKKKEKELTKKQKEEVKEFEKKEKKSSKLEDKIEKLKKNIEKLQNSKKQNKNKQAKETITDLLKLLKQQNNPTLEQKKEILKYERELAEININLLKYEQSSIEYYDTQIKFQLIGNDKSDNDIETIFKVINGEIELDIETAKKLCPSIIDDYLKSKLELEIQQIEVEVKQYEQELTKKIKKEEELKAKKLDLEIKLLNKKLALNPNNTDLKIQKLEKEFEKDPQNQEIVNELNNYILIKNIKILNALSNIESKIKGVGIDYSELKLEREIIISLFNLDDLQPSFAKIIFKKNEETILSTIKDVCDTYKGNQTYDINLINFCTNLLKKINNLDTINKIENKFKENSNSLYETSFKKECEKAKQRIESIEIFYQEEERMFKYKEKIEFYKQQLKDLENLKKKYEEEQNNLTNKIFEQYFYQYYYEHQENYNYEGFKEFMGNNNITEQHFNLLAKSVQEMSKKELKEKYDKADPDKEIEKLKKFEKENQQFLQQYNLLNELKNTYITLYEESYLNIGLLEKECNFMKRKYDYNDQNSSYSQTVNVLCNHYKLKDKSLLVGANAFKIVCETKKERLVITKIKKGEEIIKPVSKQEYSENKLKKIKELVNSLQTFNQEQQGKQEDKSLNNSLKSSIKQAKMILKSSIKKTPRTPIVDGLDKKISKNDEYLKIAQEEIEEFEELKQKLENQQAIKV